MVQPDFPSEDCCLGNVIVKQTAVCVRLERERCVCVWGGVFEIKPRGLTLNSKPLRVTLK